jgi:putative endonuclease
MPAPLVALYVWTDAKLSSSGLTRVWEHRSGAVPGFTRRYGVDRLVWFEVLDDVAAAIQREKTLKHWLRAWKIALIQRSNPTWRDLYDEIAG